MQGVVEELAPLCHKLAHAPPHDEAAARARLRAVYTNMVDVLVSTTVRDESMRRRLVTLPLLPGAPPPVTLPGRELWASVTVRPPPELSQHI